MSMIRDDNNQPDSHVTVSNTTVYHGRYSLAQHKVFIPHTSRTLIFFVKLNFKNIQIRNSLLIFKNDVCLYLAINIFLIVCIY